MHPSTVTLIIRIPLLPLYVRHHCLWFQRCMFYLKDLTWTRADFEYYLYLEREWRVVCLSRSGVGAWVLRTVRLHNTYDQIHFTENFMKHRPNDDPEPILQQRWMEKKITCLAFRRPSFDKNWDVLMELFIDIFERRLA